MAGFGEVEYDNDTSAKQPGAAATSAGPNGAALDTPVETIDENDPRLTSEDLTVNMAANAYAMPSPPPEGVRFRAKLKLLRPKDAKGQERDYMPKSHETKGPYMATGMVASIIDPTGKYDGIGVYDRWVGTLLNRDGGHKVQTVLSRLNKPDGSAWVKPGERLSHKAWIERFVVALSGEPEIGFEPQWEWSCEQCGKDAKKAGGDYPRSVVGMRKFPIDASASKAASVAAGKLVTVHEHELKCQVNPGHGYSRAQVRIGEVFRASEVKG